MKYLTKLFMVTVIGLVILRACHHDRDPYETIRLQQEQPTRNQFNYIQQDTLTINTNNHERI